MAHFAQIDENDIVTKVLVIEQDVIDTGEFGDPAFWIQTSYNTRGGIYYTPGTDTPDPDQSKALRKNFAGDGMTYDRARDAFVPPKPYNSWVLDDFSCLWEPPVPRPPHEDGFRWDWDESSESWVKIADSSGNI